MTALLAILWFLWLFISVAAVFVEKYGAILPRRTPVVDAATSVADTL